jgi:hypothetical protein
MKHFFLFVLIAVGSVLPSFAAADFAAESHEKMISEILALWSPACVPHP